MSPRARIRRAPARFAVARPRVVLALWACLVAVLATQALTVEERLRAPGYGIPGTASAQALDLDERSFGPTINVPVLLRGPAADVDAQGARLVTALRAEPRVRVISPFGGGRGAAALESRPGRALVIAVVERPAQDALTVAAPTVEGIVERTTSAPVRAHVTGQAVIGRALQESSLDATTAAERYAIPALIIVLLLVFGSPVAAAIPALFGVATVVVSLGLLALGALVVPLEALAVSLASMIGLALGVDYSLLIVSRFRELTASGASPPDAALGAVRPRDGRCASPPPCC